MNDGQAFCTLEATYVESVCVCVWSGKKELRRWTVVSRKREGYAPRIAYLRGKFATDVFGNTFFVPGGAARIQAVVVLRPRMGKHRGHREADMVRATANVESND